MDKLNREIDDFRKELKSLGSSTRICLFIIKEKYKDRFIDMALKIGFHVTKVHRDYQDMSNIMLNWPRFSFYADGDACLVNNNLESDLANLREMYNAFIKEVEIL